MRSERIHRRGLFAGLAALGAGTTGCDRALSAFASVFADGMPERITPPDGETIDPVHHLLGRAGFGPAPGEIEAVRSMGIEAYVDAQLDPARIDDTACDLRASVIDTYALPTSLLFEFPPDQVEVELRRHTLLRAVYSRRQLLEVMVEFWNDHFNIAIGKSLCKHLKTADDRDVIRPHALGRFRDLLGASALSPAMLVYLDGRENKRTSPGERPNENYARELLELHTLGVHGGYTQTDVMEAARCLSGFVVREEWAPGLVEFVRSRHDEEKKVVLGETIASGGGRHDVQQLLDIVAAHPSTARFISQKLASVFVADDPPASIVERATEAFLSTDGDIKAVLRVILLSEELAAAKGVKIKRPFRLLVSALRAVLADTHAKGNLLGHLDRMGQSLFSYPTPDGYPTRGDAWLGTLLWRWRFALELAEDRVDGVRADWTVLRAALARGGEGDATALLARHLFGRAATGAELAALAGGRGPTDAHTVALLLSSPAYQRY